MLANKTLNIQIKGNIVTIVEEATEVTYKFKQENPTVETIIERYMDITNRGGRV